MKPVRHEYKQSFLTKLASYPHRATETMGRRLLFGQQCFALSVVLRIVKNPLLAAGLLAVHQSLNILKFLQVCLLPSYILLYIARRHSFGGILQQKFCAFPCSDVRLRGLL